MSSQLIQQWLLTSSGWRSRGRSITAPAPDRESLVLGVDMPDTGNCGLVDNSILTVVSGTTTYTSANNGQTISNKRFDGQVKFNGCQNMTFTNCWFRGASSTQSSLSAATGEVIIATNAANSSILLLDCLIEPQNPHWASRAVKGHNVWLRRCEVRHHSDGYAVVNSNGQASNHNVRIEQCWFHSTWYASPDPGAAGGVTDNASHIDVCMQWEGGTGIYIGGNRLDGLMGAGLESVGTQITNFTNFTPARTGSDAYRMSNDARDGSGNITYHNYGNKYYDYNRDGSGNIINPATLVYPYPQYAQATSLVMFSPSTANITGANGSGFTFEKNWADGGAVGINMNDYESSGQPTIANGAVWIKDNRWGPVDGSAAPSFRTGEDFTIINSAAGAKCVITGNIRSDTGAAFNQVKW